jgi:hypothetical protein
MEKFYLCSITEFSSILLVYKKFMPIDCHGLCNSAVSSSDEHHIHLNARQHHPPNKMSDKKKYFLLITYT